MSRSLGRCAGLSRPGRLAVVPSHERVFGTMRRPEPSPPPHLTAPAGRGGPSHGKRFCGAAAQRGPTRLGGDGPKDHPHPAPTRARRTPPPPPPPPPTPPPAPPRAPGSL